MNIENAFPSNYMKAANLNGQSVELSIRSVVVETAKDDKGKEERFPVVYFNEATKGLRLNRTNAATISAPYSTETDNWIGKLVTLFPTTTEYQAKTVDCIRIQVTPEQVQRSFSSPQPQQQQQQPPQQQAPPPTQPVQQPAMQQPSTAGPGPGGLDI